MEASDSTLSMSQLDNNSIPDTTFTRNMMQSLGFTIFLSNEGTINDIIGSGNLNMISDPEIRSAIASWEAEFKLIREFEKLGKEATTTYEKYLSENVDLYRYVKGGPTLSKKLRSQIIEDRVFRNSLDIIKLNFRSLNFLYKEKEVGLDSLLGKIEDNIK